MCIPWLQPWHRDMYTISLNMIITRRINILQTYASCLPWLQPWRRAAHNMSIDTIITRKIRILRMCKLDEDLTKTLTGEGGKQPTRCIGMILSWGKCELKLARSKQKVAKSGTEKWPEVRSREVAPGVFGGPADRFTWQCRPRDSDRQYRARERR